MAYNTKRNFVNVDAVTFVNQAISASSLVAVTVGSSPLTQGVLVGFRATLRDNDGNSADTITLSIWKSNTATIGGSTAEQLASASLGFTSDTQTLSQQLAGEGVPFFQQPYVQITPGVADTDLEVTLYVAALP